MERKGLVETTIQVADNDSRKCGETCRYRKEDYSDRCWKCKLFHHRLIGTNQRCRECVKHFGK